MTIEPNEDRVQGKGGNFKGKSLLEKAARSRNERKRRKREMEAEDHAERTWVDVVWSNLQGRRKSQTHSQQARKGSLETALDALSISSPSEVLWKRLWEGYNERSFLLGWSIELIQRARGLSLPDSLALASGLNGFAELQLTNWHTMMLDQMYQKDADAQIQEEIKQNFLYRSSIPVSRAFDRWTTQRPMVDAQGQSHPQPVQIFEGGPEFAGQWPRRLSRQEEIYAQATHNLRNRPEEFVPEFQGEQSYAHLSSKDREQALFRDLIYDRDKETTLASEQTIIEANRAVQGFVFGLLAASALWFKSIYW